MPFLALSYVTFKPGMRIRLGGWAPLINTPHNRFPFKVNVFFIESKHPYWWLSLRRRENFLNNEDPCKGGSIFFFLRLSLWSISIQLFLCGTILVCNVRCNVSLGLRRDTPGWHSLCAGFKKRSLCQHDNRKGLYVTSLPCTVVLMYLWFIDERKRPFPTYDVYVIHWNCGLIESR